MPELKQFGSQSRFELDSDLRFRSWTSSQWTAAFCPLRVPSAPAFASAEALEADAMQR